MPDWVVDRPSEVSQVVEALLSGQGGTVGITTGLYGAGGFGKTTLALMVCADDRIRRQFDGGVYLVTAGRDMRDAPAIAAKVNDLIKLVAGEAATFTDPELAGQRLSMLLEAGPRRLLVIDDVWEREQLAPFTAGGRRCARLVTTRVPGLLAGQGTAVRVDQMVPEHARQVLTAGLPPLSDQMIAGLLAATGRWPLLLGLVNKILCDAAQAGADAGAAGVRLLERLAQAGPAAVDEIAGTASQDLDVAVPAQRARAVRVTIAASTSLLLPGDAERFAELAIFAEDEAIPFRLAARLWQATARLDELQASQVCARLAGLSLVSVTDGKGLVIHDVVRDFLRGELGQEQLARLAGVLLDTIAASVPAGAPKGTQFPEMAWWELAGYDRYLQDHLIKHLLDAGRGSDAESTVSDLRWVGARLAASGPAAPAADLALAGTPRAARLSAVLARTAHLLAPTEPAGAVIDVLHSRVAADADWGAQMAALRDHSRRPRLVNRWLPPDLPDPSLRRVLTGHAADVCAVAIAPDASWLASSDISEGMVRVWDTTTWQERAVLAGHSDGVLAMAAAPDGSWLATGGKDGMVRIWDTATWEEQGAFVGEDGEWAMRVAPASEHRKWVRAMAVAPDGSWLATAGNGRVRIWDPATWQQQARLAHRGWVMALAAVPDGSWLATGTYPRAWDFDVEDWYGVVTIWDTATWRKRASLTNTHEESVYALAAAPDGSWLASGGRDQKVRIWDTATWQETATLLDRYNTNMLVAAPDGSWLAADSSATLRIWDISTWQRRAPFAFHPSDLSVAAVAPDGSWLATGGSDRTVRIWDAPVEWQGTPATHWVAKLAVAPDGSWLATNGYDETVRIWDAATGRQRAALTGHYDHGIEELAVAPDGSWLVTVDQKTIRVWDAASWQERAVLTGHKGPYVKPVAVVVAPDGSWLATTGQDGIIRIWDTVTWRSRKKMSARSAGHALAVARDGSWLASIGGGFVQIWDTHTWREQAALNVSHAGHPVVAPDSNWLATSGRDGVVLIWDTVTWREVTAVATHDESINGLVVAPNGSSLTTSGYHGMVRIWDTRTWRERTALPGHDSWHVPLAISPDSNWLAIGDDDGMVRICDTGTGQVATLMRVDGHVHTCTWTGNRQLAVGGSSGLYMFDFLTPPAPIDM